MPSQHNTCKLANAKKNNTDVTESELSPTSTTSPPTATNPQKPPSIPNHDHTTTPDRAAAAAAATQAEHDLTLVEGLKRYKKAVAWSMFLSTSCIMSGYNTVLIASYPGNRSFTQNFGRPIHPNGPHEISTHWQAIITNGALLGEILGAITCGHTVERFGYRLALLVALAATSVCLFLPFFAVNIHMLLAGQILCGMPWGFLLTIPPAYAADISPMRLKPYLTSYVHLCVVLGQVLGGGVLRATETRSDEWAWRLPLAVQWVWPVPLMVGILFAPESAWWLVRRGRVQEARRALARVYSADRGDDTGTEEKNPAGMTSTETIDNALALIQQTDAHERTYAPTPSYAQCLERGPNLRRTEISSMAWLSPILCGSPLIRFSTHFYTQAGLLSAATEALTLAQYGLAVLGTPFAWFLLARTPRRHVYITGTAILLSLLLATALCGTLRPHSYPANRTIAVLLLLYSAVYSCTLGPVSYSLAAETPSARLRPKTVAFARAAYSAVAVCADVITRVVLDAEAGGRSAFLYVGLGVGVLWWCWGRLTEVTGRVDESGGGSGSDGQNEPDDWNEKPQVDPKNDISTQPTRPNPHPTEQRGRTRTRTPAPRSVPQNPTTTTTTTTTQANTTTRPHTPSPTPSTININITPHNRDPPTQRSYTPGPYRRADLGVGEFGIVGVRGLVRDPQVRGRRRGGGGSGGGRGGRLEEIRTGWAEWEADAVR